MSVLMLMLGTANAQTMASTVIVINRAFRFFTSQRDNVKFRVFFVEAAKVVNIMLTFVI